MMIKGVIFDMDGLMFDTEVLSAEGWRRGAEFFGYDEIEDFIMSIRGMTRKKIGEVFHDRYGEDKDYDAFLKMRMEYMSNWIHENGVPVKPGLYNLLSYLKEAGIPAALATSSGKDKVFPLLHSAEIYEYFSSYTTGDMVTHSKPDPEIFLIAAKNLELDPKDCLVLEDSPNGLEAGIASSCHTIAIPDLSPIPEELSSKIDAVFDSLNQVIAWIKEQNN